MAAPPERCPAARRSGRVPVWIVLVVAATLVTQAGRRLARGASDAGFETIDTRRLRLEPAGGWFDPRWEVLLAERLTAFGTVSARDREGLLLLAAEVAALPFVAAVGEPRVVWPDGLDLDLRLREPIACIARGLDYLPVAADGTILPGAWSGPPPRGTGHLPVLGLNDGAFEGARPGEILIEDRHLDALAVAGSLWRHLSEEDLRALGPVVIDADGAALTSVSEPGVRLYLERRRLVHFGRSPEADAPGELPAARKWAAVSAGLAQLETGDPRRDWDLLDVRWDRPEIRRRRR